MARPFLFVEWADTASRRIFNLRAPSSDGLDLQVDLPVAGGDRSDFGITRRHEETVHAVRPVLWLKIEGPATACGGHCTIREVWICQTSLVSVSRDSLGDGGYRFPDDLALCYHRLSEEAIQTRCNRRPDDS